MLNFRKFCLSSITVFLLVFSASIIFGAPVSSFLPTLLFSSYTSFLTIFPHVILFGEGISFDFLFKHHFSALFSPWNKALFLRSKISGIISISSLFGAWLGVCVIPLDWERPWQVWPRPGIYGATFGFLIGTVYSLSLGVFSKLFARTD